MPLDTAALDPATRDVHDLAVRLACEAAKIQRDRYETDLEIRTKGSRIDLVTEVDHACEALIVGEIERLRPDDAILAEEGGGLDRDGAEWRWIIDPLDGTTNYAHGFPRFCVSIGVERDGIRTVAVVLDPLLDELFVAVRGHGAWIRNRVVRVSSESDLGEALVATGFAYDVRKSREDNVAEFARVLKGARGLRRDGSAALDLCYVAAGRLDAYWEQKLSPWDVAAGILIVEEAGGRVSDMRGGPPPSSGRQIVASNGRVHDAILERLGA
jgi:myo-inositol-1(or 4)-monophosphatase